MICESSEIASAKTPSRRYGERNADSAPTDQWFGTLSRVNNDLEVWREGPVPDAIMGAEAKSPTYGNLRDGRASIGDRETGPAESGELIGRRSLPRAPAGDKKGGCPHREEYRIPITERFA